MSVWVNIFILLAYLLLLYQYRRLVKYFPFTKKGYLQLKRALTVLNHHYNLKLHLFIIFNILALGLLVSTLFHLKIINALMVAGLMITFFPLIILHFLREKYYELEFNQLNYYLQQLIIIFKEQPKILYCLKTISPTLIDPLQTLSNQAVKLIEQQGDLLAGLTTIEQVYSHFILINLHRLMLNVEQYGSLNYDLGLSILQDDLDDWSESVYRFKQQQRSFIFKVYALVGLSLVISFFGITIFSQLPLALNGQLYQTGILALLMINLGTIFCTTLTLGKSWIDQDEVL